MVACVADPQTKKANPTRYSIDKYNHLSFLYLTSLSEDYLAEGLTDVSNVRRSSGEDTVQNVYHSA